MEMRPLPADCIKLPISSQLQESVVNSFLGPMNRPQQAKPSLSHYFRYVTSQCYQASHFTSIETYGKMMQVAHRLKSGVPKEVVLKELLATSGNSGTSAIEQCEASIDLTVRSLLMLDVGELKNAFSGRRPLVWESGVISEFVKHVFPSTPVLDHGGIKLQRNFTAKQLEMVGGIQIRWTPNLADHLRVIDSGEYQTVFVFHHASFLEYQLHNPVYPPGLIEETIQTLKLLIPKADGEVKKWYQKLAKLNDLDPTVVNCGTLRVDERQIGRFKFWHDRLVILKQSFDEARPKTLSQWWHDRRNGVQWYTFWVAALVLILTIFFGIVQSIEGALQVYKAYYPTVSTPP